VNAGTTLDFTDSTIAFTAGGTSYLLNVPDGVVTFVPTATEASTSFDGVAWNTVVPASFGKDVFLSGLAFQVPVGGLDGVTGGARGGGSNWTGSYSGTVESATCTVVVE
jgi:hypothetical protein